MKESADATRILVTTAPDCRQWLEATARSNSASISSEIVRSIRERMDREDAKARAAEVKPAKRGPRQGKARPFQNVGPPADGGATVPIAAPDHLI
jgi:hypothetical protein